MLIQKSFMSIVVLISVAWLITIATADQPTCSFKEVPDHMVYSIAGGKVQFEVKYEGNGGFLRLQDNAPPSKTVIYVIDIVKNEVSTSPDKAPYNAINIIINTNSVTFIMDNVTKLLERTYMISLLRCGNDPQTTVTVKRVDPPQFVETNTVKYYKEGDHLNETCSTIAEPLMQVTWYLAGKKLVQGNASAILTLTNKLTRNNGAGIYTCCANNTISDICRNLTIIVQCEADGTVVSCDTQLTTSPTNQPTGDTVESTLSFTKLISTDEQTGSCGSFSPPFTLFIMTLICALFLT